MKTSQPAKKSEGKRNAHRRNPALNPSFFMIIAIVALLMIALFLVIGRMSMGDAAIFLYSDKCSVCKNVEPEIRDTIAKSGLKFYKARYDEPGFTPGLILMHNDTVLITGYRDVQSLRQQICGFTKIGKACRLAGEVWG